MVHPRQTMSTLHEQAAAIKTREDLVEFVQALQADLHTHPERWENETLDRFLGALASWIEDMDGYYLNQGKPRPDTPGWRTIGEMLAAARIYE
jgi:hypothetical protein